jgi:hypothetical protein
VNQPFIPLTSEQHEQLAEEIQRQRLNEWNRERREFWKGIIVNVSTAMVVHGEVVDDNVRKAAKLALTWFDEEFGADFPIEVRIQKVRGL